MEKVINLTGRIGTENAAMVEQNIRKELGKDVTSIVFDAKDLKYISSSGLRMTLIFKKEYKDVKIINCSSEIYEIFEITGFTEMIDISKAYREVSIEGCEQIGEGFYGIVYKIDSDTIVKVNRFPDSLEMIKRETRLAKKAFVMGIPTAISYDIVKVGNLSGTVFELLEAQPVAKLLDDESDSIDFCRKSVEILKKMQQKLIKYI